MKKVSIVIPIYNVEQYIEKSLLSALKQSYENIEYLIVDDRGQDNSMEIVKKIIKQFPTKKITVIQHSENRGLSAARNTGLSYSTGDYVYFMDSDDTINTDTIENLYYVANKYNADCVEGNTKVIGGKATLFTPYKGTHCFSENLPYMFFNGDLHPSAWNKLLLKNFLIKNKITFVEGLIYEDVIFVSEICKYANTICTIGEYTYNYIIRSNSITTIVNEKSLKCQYKSIIYILNQIYNYGDSLRQIDLKKKINEWALKYSFKAACRLSVLDIKYEVANLYYCQLSDITKRNKDNGLLSYVMKLPFWLFKMLFYFPYKCYKLS